jgi:cobalamin biosynthesis Mg chelatase CobN
MKPFIRKKKTAIRNLISLSLLLVTVLSACNMPSQTEAAPENPVTQPSEQAVTEDLPTTEPTAEEIVVTPTNTVEPTPVVRDPSTWKEWPIFPEYMPESMQEVYEYGLANGNDPHAFSILGDCHSLPEVFLGVYDTEPANVQSLDENLQETVAQFQGSFDRYSPTVVLGSTEGALLWIEWNENEEGYCLDNELPIDCEIRYHKPTIAFIRLGTHWETRNEEYLRILIEKLLENGTVPIITTKADNREHDERINQNLINLAIEYDLPVWNFWASVQDLPDKGLSGEDNMYLSDEAYAIQRIDGLMVLDWAYRALSGN